MGAPPKGLTALTVPRLQARKPERPCLAVLWPAWQWQVVIPARRSDPLDLIQRAVLGLLASGRPDRNDIASYLALDSGVVDLVLVDLAANMYLVGQEVTAAGRATLSGRDGPHGDPEARTAFLFSDPFTGDLWPIARDRRPLDYVVQRQTHRWALVSAGTRGASDDIECFVIESPGNAEPRPPDPLKVLDAIRESDAGSDDPWSIRVTARGAVSYPRLSPQVVHLLTYIHVSTHGFTDRPWEVVDPFGGRYLPGLRASVELALAQSPPLASEIEGLLARAPNRTVSDDSVTELEPVGRLGDGAVGDMRAHHAELKRELATMRQDALSSRVGGRARLIRRADQLEEDIGRLAQSALEHALDGRSARPWLESDRLTNAATIRALSAHLGFSDQLPASVSSVTRAQVEIAMRGGLGSLRALTVASLLSAHAHRDHPLHAAAVLMPTLPGTLFRLAESRERPLRMPPPEDQPASLDCVLADATRALVAVEALVMAIHERVDTSVSDTTTTTEVASR